MAKLITTDGETIEVDLLNFTAVFQQPETYILFPGEYQLKMTKEELQTTCSEDEVVPVWDNDTLTFRRRGDNEP